MRTSSTNSATGPPAAAWRSWKSSSPRTQPGRTGNGTKGRRFDAAREALLEGARRGHYQVVLIWALDRLTRRGMEDMLATVRRFLEQDCLIWSLRESFMEELRDPRAKILFTGLSGWNAEGESGRRSDRIRAGMARVKREMEAQIAAGKEPEKKIGGWGHGKDKRRRDRDGYKAAWKPGGAQYEAAQKRARTYTCQNPGCGKEFTSTSTTGAKFCSVRCQQQHRHIRTNVKAAQTALGVYEEHGEPVPERWGPYAHTRTAMPEASWGQVAEALGITEKEAQVLHGVMMGDVARLRGASARKAAAQAAAFEEAVAALEKAGIPDARELLAAKRAAQENGSGEDQGNVPATG